MFTGNHGNWIDKMNNISVFITNGVVACASKYNGLVFSDGISFLVSNTSGCFCATEKTA
jgi:hypothetical protein